jgi:hypothetical protein
MNLHHLQARGSQCIAGTDLATRSLRVGGSPSCSGNLYSPSELFKTKLPGELMKRRFALKTLTAAVAMAGAVKHH